ncbi:MAG: transporter substrate-binding domain-containing protein [Alphaproteobacteria bacterium]|nr:transporter substrate-binding domain-containing protein [Alphaproteobacteria bacterium]MBL6946552.1 transporter substrate-binding domain-containing protein [Rhodospirillales bacterium]
MRLAFVLLVLCWLPLQAAKAESLKISAPEFPEAEAITRLLKEVYGQLGYDLERVVRPAKRSLVEVNNGSSDAELARVTGAESEYPNLVRVTEPVFALSFSALVNSKSKHWLSSWEEIEKYRIGFPRGYRLLDIRTKGMNAQSVSDPAAVSRMVKVGRIDIGIVVTSDAHRFASESDDIVVLKPPIEAVTLYHYLNVKHRRLVPAMEIILIQLNDSGRAREIFYGEK